MLSRIYVNIVLLILLMLCGAGCRNEVKQSTRPFLHVDGRYLMTEDGERFMVRGTNLGNWLNPEGYMFGFQRCNSVGKINQAFSELIGPEATYEFWQAFRSCYVTESDIAFIASIGANTIRLPFHYQLFTSRGYMGEEVLNDYSFAEMDSVVAWCDKYGLYLILDMHDCPAGQTGDNIDDSYGYPWLFTSPQAQSLFIRIWERIAAHYQDEPVVLGYELMNEPIAHYFQDSLSVLNAALEPLYVRTVEAIRQIDSKHIILLGGAQWNGTFRGVFHEDWQGRNIAYACHRYQQSPDSAGIGDFISWRDSTNICTIMTETGHNTYEWIEQMTATMEHYEIGYTYWPYKKMGRSSWIGFPAPDDWDQIRAYVEDDRSTYKQVRDLHMDAAVAKAAIMQYAEHSKLENCTIDTAYIRAMKLNL